MSTITETSLSMFRTNLLQGIREQFPFMGDHADERVTDVAREIFSNDVLDLDTYEDYEPEDIVYELETKMEDLISELRESDDYINESVQWSHPMVYTQDYLEYYAKHSVECDEAFYSCHGSISEYDSIGNVIAAAVCLHLENKLREELEEIADCLEDMDVLDYL